MIRSFPALLLTALTLMAAAPKPSPAPTRGAVAPPTFTVGVWTIHSSLMDISLKQGDFSTPNQVFMTRAGGDITADRASGNYKTKNATLYGHVVMHDTEGNFAGLSQTKPAQSHGPSTLTADQVQIDGTAKQYVATGNVRYVQADTVVDANKGTLNDTQHDLLLEGKVHIVQGDRNVTGDRVDYNTVTGQARVENAVMQFPSEVNPHIATPKPIHLRNPLLKPQPSSAPAASPSPAPSPSP